MKNNYLERIRQTLGLGRSLLIYYGVPFRGRKLRKFYQPFIKPGDLCFDIGAHVGNRLHAWSRLGARIVALEPQPEMMHFLQRVYGRYEGIILRSEAVGATPGQGTMYISRRTPTVSTLSATWKTAVQRDGAFAGVQWDSEVMVPVTTLDQLIAEYGRPSFCKIDVEGFELEVLRGLNQALEALSFEFIPATWESARDCLLRLADLGKYSYNFTPGESQKFQFATWLSQAEMLAQLDSLRIGGRSGDIFARHTQP